ncbi:MAG: hypothetical protein RR840_07960 [Clostridium sp.]
MKKVIKSELKRILSMQVIIILFILVFGFSFVSSILKVNSYNIYNASGEVEISGWDNIRESQKKSHNMILNQEGLIDIVKRKDKSKYIYNINAVRIANSVYLDKKLAELTDKNIKEFYLNREVLLNKIISSYDKNNQGISAKERKYLTDKISKLKTPIEIGYAEGWKNLNNDMIDFVIILIACICIVILPIYGEDPKVNMRGLYFSTVNGKTVLLKAKLYVGIQVGVIIYILGILIFTISRLGVLGFQGGGLPIQGSVTYFLSLKNITYFQQFILNSIIGFGAVIMSISFILLVTSITRSILSGGVILTFMVILVTLSPSVSLVNRYFLDFMPYNMTNFNVYYLDNDIYNIYGNIYDRSTVVVIASFIISLINLLLVRFTFNKQLKI